MAKVKETKIDTLIPDDKNMNKHNQYGMALLEKSISQLGLGRSILVDKNNKIIAGNGVAETAANIGLDNVIIVPTDGKQLVVVQRTDLDIDSKEARELALADNSIAHVNLEWDEEAIAHITEQWGIEAKDWGVTIDEPTPIDTDPFEDEGISQKNQFGVIVLCESEQQQEKTFAQLEQQGYKCKVVVV